SSKSPRPSARPRPSPSPRLRAAVPRSAMRSRVREPPQEAELPVEEREGLRQLLLIELAEGDRDPERVAHLGGAAGRDAIELNPVAILAARALAEVERDAARRAPHLVGQGTVHPSEP